MKHNDTNIASSVALGFFDGLHIGHTEVIKTAAGYKNADTAACVLLFDDHPQHVLNGTAVPRLLQNKKRDELLYRMGVVGIGISFERIKDMSPEEFVKSILVKELSAVHVTCGYNYRFGKNGSGDTELLQNLCDRYGIALTVCHGISVDNIPVSSTAIRKLIEAGNVCDAAKMLGRPFAYSSEVIAGEKRGRGMGTPTVNQLLPDELVVPHFGVYVSSALVNGIVYKSVTDIGLRPTFGGTVVRSETYILDFTGDLYGSTPEISLLDFIRPEIKFASSEELRQQIFSDVEYAQRFFENTCNKSIKNCN